MTNRIVLLIVSFFFGFASFSQFGNEWIDYDQRYYSFKIHEDGVYRIDYALLSAAGVPLSSISPDNFQVFGFEKEQSIKIEDGGDGTFDPGDYILFFGQKNSTWLDSLMYDTPDDVANKYYPLYNDTINYYLTWNSSVTNQRITQETDIDFDAYSPAPYFLKTSFKEGHSTYMEAFRISGLSQSNYTNGEGWFGGRFTASAAVNRQDDNLTTTNVYTGVGAPIATGISVSAGASNAVHSGPGNHHLQLQYGPSNIILEDTIFRAYQKNKFEFEIPLSSLGSSTTRIRYQLINDLGVAADHQAVAFTELTYPHTPNLEGESYFELTVPFNTLDAKTRYSFTGFSGASPRVFTLDGTMREIPVVLIAGNYEVLIPNSTSGGDQKIVIFDSSVIESITAVSPINGTGTFTNYSTVDFESAYMMISHSKLWSSALQYKAYRESLTGGGFNVVLTNIEELNHQFGGGVNKHIMGLRRFAHYAYTLASDKPEYMFIVGKGIREANENLASAFGTRQNPFSYEDCLIPAFGYPASDNLTTARLEGNLWAPLIPTGRLAANNDEQVLDYLEKAQAFDEEQDPNSVYSQGDKLWQKQILHFGGGANEVEQNTFKFYLQNYEKSLESTKFGGNVESYFKTVSDPVDPALLTEVTERISKGVSLMTFFGHASADGFDQNIDDPYNWNNRGKYPIVVGNACLTGNIFDPASVSTSENYVLTPEQGSIAFLANVTQAFANSLNSYSQVLFAKMANENYGESLSKQMQETIKAIQSETMSFGLQSVCNQMTLHGDPAIGVNSHEKPEIEINNSSLFITPEVVDLTVDSIDVNLVLYSLGQSVTDTFAVELTRSFPNGGGDSIYTKLVSRLDYIDTIVFTIPFYNNIGVGLNTFKASVDIPSIIEEQYDEVNNNILIKQVLFDVDGIQPVWPYNYAVIPDDTVTLSASTINPFAELATYRFEVDTTDLFNSPSRLFKMTSSKGGVVDVAYNDWLSATSGLDDELILTDSTVYFWRVAVEDGSGEYNWIENSFQYIEGRTGWGQDHFFQFKNNEFLFLDYEREIRNKLFGPSFKSIRSDVYGNAGSFFEFAFTAFFIDENAVDEGYGENNFCTTNPQLMVAVIDPFTLKSWGTRWSNFGTIPEQNSDHDFGNANDNSGCRNRVENHFGFYQNNPVEMEAFENMMTNEIPDSTYYLIYTTRFANYSAWDSDNSTFDVFDALGCDSITPGKEDVPFIVFGKMGDTSSTREVYGQSIDEFISLSDTLRGFDFFGGESSTIIGPAQEWGSVHWKQYALEDSPEDSTQLRIIGISGEGTRTVVIDTLMAGNDSIINLASMIDAEAHPFIQLSVEYWDSTGFTPTQIDGWHVLYSPAPEAALDGSGTAGIHWIPGDTIVEGQQFEVAFDIVNIGDIPMDSLLINYWIEDAAHNLIPIPYPRQDSLRIGETIRDTLTFESLGFPGFNSLWVEVNPFNEVGVKDQIEQYHFNNIGQIPFEVLGDNENPILDVTFNGSHILNGDLIDPNSEVLITLKDENEFLIMDSEADTANFGIYLTDPNGVQRQLHFRNSVGEVQMEWIPADVSNKKFKILYDSQFQLDGTYRLLVQGVDKSGNISGDFQYDIEFEVDHNSSITHLTNYPNPFSTRTQFVFTLTGARIPDQLTIQIMTVTGKVVREITKDELGPIRIGRNITDYAWDGNDEFGDRLANGVYLYRVIVKIDGEDVEHRETGADRFFTKEFGKMYLIR